MQDLPIGQVFEMTQVHCVESKLKQSVHHAIDQDAGLWAKILRNFAPLSQPPEGTPVDLTGGKSGRRLGQVTAVAFAEVAPLIVGSGFDPVSGFPENLDQRSVGCSHV